MHGRRFCMRWIIRGWPGPSADGLGPRLAPNTSEHYVSDYPDDMSHYVETMGTVAVAMINKHNMVAMIDKHNTVAMINKHN